MHFPQHLAVCNCAGQSKCWRCPCTILVPPSLAKTDALGSIILPLVCIQLFRLYLGLGLLPPESAVFVQLQDLLRAKTVPFLVIFSWLVSVFVFTILCCNNISQFKALILIPMNVLRIFGFGCYLCWTASVLCCGSACASVVFELCGQHYVEASVPALMLVCCTISDNNVCTSDGNNVCLL